MNFFRSLIFYFVFYLWTFCFFVFFSQVRFFSDSFIISLSNFWSRSVVLICKKILLIDYEVLGEENIPKKGPFLITSNHQSAWETFFFTALFKGSVFILKNEDKKTFNHIRCSLHVRIFFPCQSNQFLRTFN